MSNRILYIVALATLLVPMSNTVYNPNIPIIQEDLGTTTQLIALTVSAFTAMIALAQLIYGPISDKRGRKGVLVFGLLVYVVSSIAIFFAKDIYQIIALRAAQAFGVSAGMVVGAAILSDVYRKNLGSAMGTYQSIILIGPLIGPVIGGVIASFFGWRSIFLFLSLLGVAALAVVHLFLKETLEKSHVSHPLAALKLLRDAKLFFVSFLGFATLATIYVFITFFPIILYSYGISAAGIGFLFLPSGIALLLGSKLGGRLVSTKGARHAILLGAAINVLATAAFAFFVHLNSGLLYVLGAFAASAFGSGMFWTSARVYVVGRSALKASANGAFNFMSFLGATAASFVGSLVFDMAGALILFTGFALFMLFALALVVRKC